MCNKSHTLCTSYEVFGPAISPFFARRLRSLASLTTSLISHFLFLAENCGNTPELVTFAIHDEQRQIEGPIFRATNKSKYTNTTHLILLLGTLGTYVSLSNLYSLSYTASI